MTFFKQFWRSPVFVRIVGALCWLGIACNIGLLVRDYLHHTGLWQLHCGFLILYTGQTVFMFLRERYACVLTVLQGFAALRTAADFIFTPVLQILGFLYLLTGPSLQAQKIYEYIFVSAAFTLQMASAAYLWFYFSQEK